MNNFDLILTDMTMNKLIVKKCVSIYVRMCVWVRMYEYVTM